MKGIEAPQRARGAFAEMRDFVTTLERARIFDRSSNALLLIQVGERALSPRMILLFL